MTRHPATRLHRAAVETLETRRLLAMITPDTTFGDDGVSTFDIGPEAYDSVEELIVLGDNIYAIGGSAERDDLGPGPLPQQFAPPFVTAGTVARLTSDGSVVSIAPLSSFPALAGFTELEQAPGGDTLYVGTLDAFGADPAFVVTRLDSILAVDPTFTQIRVPLNLDPTDFPSGFDYGVDFDVDSAGNVAVVQFTTGPSNGFADVQRFDASGVGTGSFVVPAASADGFTNNGFREVGILDDGGVLLSYAKLPEGETTTANGVIPAVLNAAPNGAVRDTIVSSATRDGQNERYDGFYSHPDGRFIAVHRESDSDLNLLSSGGGRLFTFGNASADGLSTQIWDIVFPESGGAAVLSLEPRDDAPLVNSNGFAPAAELVLFNSVVSVGSVTRQTIDLDFQPSSTEAGIGYARSLALTDGNFALVGGTLAQITTMDNGEGTLIVDDFDTPAAVWKYSLDGDVTPGEAFEEVNGVVTIEAAEFTEAAASGSLAWVEQSDANALDGRFMTVPDAGGVNTGNSLTGPKLDYDINFQNSGTYYVWVRMTGDGGANDSIHVGLNGQASTLGGFGLSSGDDNVFRWTNGTNSLSRRITVDVPSPGVHTLNVWMREDGVKVDDIRVARSINFDPNVANPPPPPPPNVAPTIASLLDAPDPVQATDGFITLTATGVNDVDGTVASVSFFDGQGTLLGADSNGSNGWSLQVDISGLAAGAYTYSAVARDDDGAESQPVQTTNTVAPAQTGPAFEEVDGVVTIEAADASRRATAGNGVAWVDVADSAAVGGTLVQALPDIDSNTGTALTGPKLDYDINFQNSGIYYVWVRMTGDGGANDSIHVGLNGQAETLDGQFGFYSNNRNVLEWTDGITPLGRRLTVNVPSAGVHTLNIWAREDGVRVDEIRVARSVDFDPRVATPPPPPPNQAPTIGALVDSPDPAPIDSEILIQATGVNDVDGTVPLVRFFREVVGGEDVLLFTDRNPSNGFAGFISVAELAPGSTTTYYAIAEDNDGAQSTRAVTTNTVLNPAGGPVYQETAGLVTIEASRPSALVQNTGLPSWDVFNQPGAIGESPNVLQAFGEGSNFGNTTDGPRADYDITFTNTGTYFVWVRMNGPNGSDDSIHVGLNNDVQTLGAFGVYPGAKNTFEWVNDVPGLGRIAVDVPEPGISTLNIWMREDGVIVDEIRLSSDPNFNPAVANPPPPPPPTNTAPTVASLTASPNPIVVGDFVTLTANGVFDSDGTIASVTFGYEDGTFGDQVIGVDSDGSNGFSLVDSTFDIGAGRTYYAFATDDDGAFSNRVEVRLNTISEPTDAFQEVDGLVTIEATDATARTSAQGREWVDDTRPDAINGTFVTAPGEGVNTGGQANGPRLDYDIEFANSGTYYVWLRMTAEDFGSDSVHVGLNGQSVTTNTFGVSGGGDDVFTWTDGSNSINRRLTVNVPAAGVQTLNIWMREDGVKVDEIRVARSESYDPRGFADGRLELALGEGFNSGEVRQLVVSDSSEATTWVIADVGTRDYPDFEASPVAAFNSNNPRPELVATARLAFRIDDVGNVLERRQLDDGGLVDEVEYVPARDSGFWRVTTDVSGDVTFERLDDSLVPVAALQPFTVEASGQAPESFDVTADDGIVFGQAFFDGDEDLFAIRRFDTSGQLVDSVFFSEMSLPLDTDTGRFDVRAFFDVRVLGDGFLVGFSTENGFNPAGGVVKLDGMLDVDPDFADDGVRLISAPLAIAFVDAIETTDDAFTAFLRGEDGVASVSRFQADGTLLSTETIAGDQVGFGTPQPQLEGIAFSESGQSVLLLNAADDAFLPTSGFYGAPNGLSQPLLNGFDGTFRSGIANSATPQAVAFADDDTLLVAGIAEDFLVERADGSTVDLVTGVTPHLVVWRFDA